MNKLPVPKAANRPRHLQRGVATLPISLILLVLLTLITVYAARVGLLETRTSANKVRAEEAFTAAEAGTEQGVAYVSRNKTLISGTGANGWLKNASDVHWVVCAASDIALPCGNGTANVYGATWLRATMPANRTIQPATGGFTLHFLTPCRDHDNNGTCDTVTGSDIGTGPYEGPPITMIAAGASADQSGSSVVRQTLYFYDFSGGGGAAPVPLMAAGTIGTSGNFSVVANPDGAGKGVALSTWSRSNAQVSSAASTCHLGSPEIGGNPGEGFLGTDGTYVYQTDTEGNSVTMCASCVCPSTPDTGTLTHAATNAENYDILDVDSNVGVNPDSTYFPDDVFEFIFHVPAAQYSVIKNQATVLPNCDSLGTGSQGLIWVTGDCHPGNNVGSFAHPVLIVVECAVGAGGNCSNVIKINSNNYIFGVIFAFHPGAPTAAPYPDFDVDLNGTPTVYGAIISNIDLNISNGTYKLRFDTKVLANLAKDASGRGIGRLPGSWSDYH